MQLYIGVLSAQGKNYLKKEEKQMDFKEIAKNTYNHFLEVIREFAPIPAPSGMEDERARYCLNYFKKIGVDAYIDEAKNVICILGDKNAKDITVFMGHTDVVFPDTTPLPYTEDDEKIYCPGIGDDTARLVTMLEAVKYIVENKIIFPNTLMFVANSCEEGLGNLRGCRQIFKDFGDRIKALYTFDNQYNGMVNKSVGSHRYKVIAKTQGGHSFGNFGRKNAISVLAKIICEIEEIEVPKIEDSRTTYNIGTISGGTSVNTIAQYAETLVEYRSDNVDCLAIMEEKFANIFKEAEKDCLELIVERVGDRPCMKGVDMDELQKITDEVCAIQHKHTGVEIKVGSGSTDCNIPHSLGVPAVCVGTLHSNGSHTREEWLIKSSFIEGFAVTLDLIMTVGNREV